MYVVKISIGLISADEVAYAGAKLGTPNSSYYLYTGQSYWTMSPRLYDYYASVHTVASNGNVGNGYVNSSNGIRPVINLKADILLKGSGTSTDPYVVEGAE